MRTQLVNNQRTVETAWHKMWCTLDTKTASRIAFAAVQQETKGKDIAILPCIHSL